MTAKFDSNDSHIDLRDVTERVEELRSERDDFVSDATDTDSPISYCELADAQGAAELAWAVECAEDFEELATLESLLSELAGYGGNHQWEGAWYPLGLIHEDSFVDDMREMVSDIGDLPDNVPSYLAIDWNATAENLRVDYSSVEFDGATYWYR